MQDVSQEIKNYFVVTDMPLPSGSLISIVFFFWQPVNEIAAINAMITNACFIFVTPFGSFCRIIS